MRFLIQELDVDEDFAFCIIGLRDGCYFVWRAKFTAFILKEKSKYNYVIHHRMIATYKHLHMPIASISKINLRIAN